MPCASLRQKGRKMYWSVEEKNTLSKLLKPSIALSFILNFIEFDGKRGSLLGPGLAHDPAPHEFHVFFDDGQSQSQRSFSTRRLSTQPLKFLKDLVKILFREAGAMIVHTDPDFSVQFGEGRFDRLPFFRKLDRVG